MLTVTDQGHVVLSLEAIPAVLKYTAVGAPQTNLHASAPAQGFAHIADQLRPATTPAEVYVRLELVCAAT